MFSWPIFLSLSLSDPKLHKERGAIRDGSGSAMEAHGGGRGTQQGKACEGGESLRKAVQGGVCS